jgi:hypothetical protein
MPRARQPVARQPEHLETVSRCRPTFIRFSLRLGRQPEHGANADTEIPCNAPDANPFLSSAPYRRHLLGVGFLQAPTPELGSCRPRRADGDRGCGDRWRGLAFAAASACIEPSWLYDRSVTPSHAAAESLVGLVLAQNLGEDHLVARTLVSAARVAPVVLLRPGRRHRGGVRPCPCLGQASSVLEDSVDAVGEACAVYHRSLGGLHDVTVPAAAQQGQLELLQTASYRAI